MHNSIIIVDLDGTMTIVGDRIECLQRKPKNWNEFYLRCGEDKPNIPVVNLVFQLYSFKRYDIIFLTGRVNSCKVATEEWLSRHGFFISTYELLMRKDGDFRHDTIVKPELIKHIDPSQISFILEDRSSMVKKWRELGYTCFQVAEGNF